MRLSQQWGDRSRDDLIERYREAVERHGRHLDTIYPGMDWPAICATGLYRAAYTFEPGRKTFFAWLAICISSEKSSHRKTWRSRAAKLCHRIELSEADERMSGRA